MAFVFMAFIIAGAATLTITAASDGSLGEFSPGGKRPLREALFR